MRRDSGTVLLNALVLVLAVTLLAAGLMRLAESGRARLTEGQATAQLALYTEAIEALVPVLLEAEWEEGGIDDLSEFWATRGYEVPIDRGRVAAGLTDQQGLMNINALSFPGDVQRAEFARLFARLGLPAATLDAIDAFLSGGGPPQPGAYLSRPLPVQPTGGPVRLVEELRQVEGLGPSAYARLAPFVSALPPEVYTVNVNTAPPEVLAALLPDVGADGLRAILADRSRKPYASAVDFRARATELVGEEALKTVQVGRFVARSGWFQADLAAEVDGRVLRRRVLYARDDQEGGATRRVWSRAVPEALP